MTQSAMIKVAVLNFSGNVGKTTLARHLLKPRMNGCPIMHIESINEGGDENNIKGKNFSDAMVKIMDADQAIMDIGSSNIEEVFARAAHLGQAFHAFDYFLIPTVSSPKQQADTVKVLVALQEMGVTCDRLKVVLNHAAAGEDQTKAFATVVQFTSALNIGTAVVHHHEGYSKLGTMTVAECAARGRDFRSERREETDPAKKTALSTAEVRSWLAQSIEAELDGVFATLFNVK